MTAETDAGIPCMLMRAGTSKGAYFLAEDLPEDAAARDDLVLRIMGSPDPAQLDGLGGGHPLTSKVAIVSRCADDAADLDYLFLQVVPDKPVVGTRQTCGNLLAGVAPFAAERGLVAPDGAGPTRIRLVNTGDLAVVRPSDEAGAWHIAVSAGPGKSLLPTGRVAEDLLGHRVTLIDGGMPVVLLDAAEFDVHGTETPAELEARADLRAEVERVRLAAGGLMGLGDVSSQTVPKMLLIAPPRANGAIACRAFIPARVHPGLGALMAASAAAGIRIPGAVGSDVARTAGSGPTVIEHPGGTLTTDVQVEQGPDGEWHATSRTLRTARKIFDGRVFARPEL
ncbi:MAG: PrpF domain-containing protein [Microbacterium sp.]